MLMYSIAVHSGISHSGNEKVETFETTYQVHKDKTQDHTNKILNQEAS